MTASVIFDLDGTLADTSGDLVAAANSCFRDLGLGDLLDATGDATTALQGGRAMLRLGFSRACSHGEDEVDRQYPRLLEAYEGALDVHSRLYPGVRDALIALSQAGYRLGVCTNKPERLADMLLASLGVRAFFAALIGADTLPVRKPDPEPLLEAIRRVDGDVARGCLVGDTVTDRETARAAGLPAVLVTFGPLGRGVAELEPDALLDQFLDLPEIVERLEL